LKDNLGLGQNLPTDVAIYKLLNEIQKALNRKNIIEGIFCDLKKAFDCVDHEFLLSTWVFCGVKSKLWFKLYLSNRYQKVLITNTNFNPNEYLTWGKIRHGVLQGLILGPLYYIYYKFKRS
jgi:hypothetical protein